MRQLHEIQLEILKKLLFADKLRFTDMKPDPEMENNQFTFHLDQLIEFDYIQKGPRHYSLTSKGKEYANRMDTDKTKIALQSKVSAWVCCSRQKNDQAQYLIYTRLKQPFYGCQGFLSGKVRYGEKIIDAAKRELKEETGLTGEPQIIMIKHYLVYNKNYKELLEDKFMFLCLVKNPKGKLKANNEGKFEWVGEKDLKRYVTNHFESWGAFEQQVKEIQNFDGHIALQEIDHQSEKF
ncbi:hypothetical protein A2630_01610 [Candidatus Woesebacteria bacterium RIFCSPHIGHO2_01_FULL_44_10]|uniref:Nudix hydrolase domain-containing protein n=1 Tax=Candidatus Woesebacteria bacterium RIFCSPLOWO2_01_FULL_44_14 TaxID=1802525 RepID=A0A1F8C1W9_9BACT|nr:MAG: hypothetical protein A2630_01610 [Candidatus Woesebacteria bacterium RIFCSPHIGHO2_01_FULL_44_10]OGM54950.1 MAG: hypothetical protein A3F62_00910 [Candidatus Woesebacteria bacterium RIFCSPHIGHO2_12_FULL_44_11]OGM70337.1 MAG: hypothetical protein A2975_04695 [Candidatus Woesebacteria bacterium RIFCSPLOWO2_01_FULL_44_14]